MIELIVAVLVAQTGAAPDESVPSEPMLPERSALDWRLGRPCGKAGKCAGPRFCHPRTQTCEVACNEQRLCRRGKTCVSGACLRESPEGKARDFAQQASEKLFSGDFRGAVRFGHAALALKPKRKGTLCVSWRALGHGYQFLNRTKSAERWLALFRDKCQ